MSQQSSELETVEFSSLQDYLRLVQNPATRSSDPMELLLGAQSALTQFSEPTAVASALCVIIYRYLETESVRHLIDLADIEAKYQVAKNGLRDIYDLPSIRWYLSLNMAVANLRLQLDQPALALATLQENIDRKEDALLQGQPFTNVIKSAAAALGIMKYRNPEQYSRQYVSNIVEQFSGLGGEITARYRFENQWVFEELALVFRTLYSIAKTAVSLKNTEDEPSTSNFLNEFDDTSIPNSFLRLLRPRRG
jgi:hypothetical protein